ncbi:MAG TPA: nitrilase-related carbon-nitrogen hydrolase [Solirubrobacteraceae bacterium]|jgi:predicted amidohydrolase|nr:nitrilase-related carbon-nitrogen hydrolase [Solirubrobacteraceae bacterium]
MTRIVCQQFGPRVGEVETNRRLTVNAVASAVGEHRADIVVLPELSNSGYMFQSPQEAASLAITRDDSLFKEWAAEASRGDAVVIGGFCERGDDGQIYNSAIVVEGRGVIGVYRKTHLWDREKLHFKPGGEAPGVFDTPHGRIGVLVCYDIEFPEMTRTLALAGAELIAVPTNWPLSDRPEGERPPEVTIAQAAARVNRVFVACCDRTGTERGQEWTGGTAIVDENGFVRGSQAGTGPAKALVDLSRSHDKSLTRLADVFGDRRPELYGAVVQSPAAAGD